jgi:hypothetical protein
MARRVGAPCRPLGHSRGGPAALGGTGDSGSRGRASTAGRGRGGTPAPGQTAAGQSAPSGGRDAWDQSAEALSRPRGAKQADLEEGGDSGGNAAARVEGAYQSIGACDGTAEANDPPPAVPMAQVPAASLAQAGRARPKATAGVVQKMARTSDRGDYREAAADAGEQVGVEPSRATGRQRPQAPAAEGSAAPTTATERRAATVRTPAGRAR